jgi:phage protein D
MSKFSSLNEKYGNFVAPVYSVLADGTEIKPDMASIASIRVDLSMGDVASACRFTLFGIYDRESRKVSDAVLKALKPGATLEISLGYISNPVKVFTGFVAETSLHYANDEEGVYLQVTGLDARALMKDSYTRTLSKDKTIKALLEGALKNYGPLIKKVEAQVDDLTSDIYLAQVSDDLEFVCNAARLRGLYFYIDCGTAYIGKAKSDVSIEFDWEQCVADLSLRYLEREYTAQGYDHGKMKEFTATAKAKGLAAQKSLVTLKTILPLPSCYTDDVAKTIAEAAALSDKRNSVGGELTCPGIPEPKIGQKLKLNKSPLASTGMGESFLITAIHHSMDDESGYHSTIEFAGVA